MISCASWLFVYLLWRNVFRLSFLKSTCCQVLLWITYWNQNMNYWEARALIVTSPLRVYWKCEGGHNGNNWQGLLFLMEFNLIYFFSLLVLLWNLEIWMKALFGSNKWEDSVQKTENFLKKLITIVLMMKSRLGFDYASSIQYLP